MHLLIITHYFYPENFRINDLSSELVNRGHDVTVLTGFPNYPNGNVYRDFFDNRKFYCTYKGCKIIRVPVIPRGKTFFGLFLNYLSFCVSASILGFWQLRFQKFDAVFVFQPSPITVAIPASIFRRIKKIPVVLWVLDLWPETLQALGVVRSKFFLFLLTKLVIHIYRNTDLILAQSKFFISHIKKYSPKNSLVEYLPSWTDHLRSEDVSPANELLNVLGKFNVIFTGNIGEAQDFPSIIDAAEILRGDSNIRWIIVGEGRMANWLSTEVSARKLDDVFFLVGSFPLDRMKSFYACADALLVSLKQDPIFSLTIPGKLQSYLSAGKPILAMLDGEGARIINESGAGLCSPPGNAQGLADSVKKLVNMSLQQKKEMGLRGISYNNKEFNREFLINKIENKILHTKLLH